SEILTMQPTMVAHSRAYPNRLPATRVATRSPAPTPVAATTIPGPSCLHVALRCSVATTGSSFTARTPRLAGLRSHPAVRLSVGTRPHRGTGGATARAAIDMTQVSPLGLLREGPAGSGGAPRGA